MDGFTRNTHYVPIRQEWSYILDRRRNEALSAFRFDIASFLRVPLEDVKDLLVRPDIRMIEFQVKYTKLLTLTDVNAILKRCEYPEMTLLVYDSYYPNGIPLDINPQGPGGRGEGGLRPQLADPRDPTLDDRAYRMYFPGKYWEELLQTWRVEAELAAKKDISDVLQATEINQKMPEIITTFKSEPDGTWLVYRVDDNRENRRAARRDFFARSPFSHLWALYAEHSSADPGWMTRGVSNTNANNRNTGRPGLVKPNTYANSSARGENTFPVILSEEPDGEVHFPGTRWPLVLQRRLRDLKRAGKQDLINVLADHGEAFLGAPHVKVRFEPQATGARMQCKILNPVGLSSSQVEARRRMINGYHYPLVMSIYDNFDPNQQSSSPSGQALQRSGRISDLGPVSPRGGPSSARGNGGFKLPMLVSSPKRRGGAGSPNTPRYGSAAGSPRSSSSRFHDPAYRTNTQEYNDFDGQRPCTYRVSFPGSMWKTVLMEASEQLHEVAVRDVQDLFMQVEKLMRAPHLDVTFTLKPEKKGIRCFFMFHDTDFKKPTKIRHSYLHKCKFPQTWDLYRSIRDQFMMDYSNSSLSRTRMEVERSVGNFSVSSRGGGSPTHWSSSGVSSPRKNPPNTVVPSSRGSAKPSGSSRPVNTFPVNLNEPPMNITEPTGKGLELYVPFPDVHWGENYALERASEVDHVVRRDIQAILTQTGATSEMYEPPCILATFVPTGVRGAMLYIKFSRRDRKLVDKARPALLDYRNYTQLRSFYSSLVAQ